MKSTVFALGLLAAAAARPAFAGQDIVNDGSFEDPKLATCCQHTFTKGDTMGGEKGWTVTAGRVVLTSGAMVKGGYTFLAHEGNQWLHLAGGPKPGRLEQTFKMEQGTYTLRFNVGSVFSKKRKYGSSSSVILLVDGSPTGTYTTTAADDGHNKQQWSNFTLRISTGNPRITLAFVGADPKEDTDCGLDDISFNRSF